MAAQSEREYFESLKNILNERNHIFIETVSVDAGEDGYGGRLTREEEVYDSSFVHSEDERKKALNMIKLLGKSCLDEKVKSEISHMIRMRRKEAFSQIKRQAVTVGVLAAIVAAVYLPIRACSREEQARNEKSFLFAYNSAVEFREEYKNSLEGKGKFSGWDKKYLTDAFSRQNKIMENYKEDVKHQILNGYNPIMKKDYKKLFGSEPWWPKEPNAKK